jgi:hypothetical protein
MIEWGLFTLKACLLYWAVVFGCKYIVCTIHAKDIASGVAHRMAIGVAGFVALQWLLP